MNSFLAAASILLIGDSHTVASFGHRLDELLRTLPDKEIATYASCGSSPYGWFTGSPTHCGYYEHTATSKVEHTLDAPTPLIEGLLAQHKPQLTIVVLGANLYGAPLDHSAQTTQRMAEAIARSGSQCLWVGPPHSRVKTDPLISELNGVLRGAATPYCRYIDSRPLAHYPDTGGDGIHYDHLGAPGVAQMHSWAAAIFQEIKKAL